MIHVKQNDRRPPITTVLSRGATIVDLTLATSVTFKMSLMYSDVGNLKVNALGIIDVDPTTGGVSYAWGVGDTDSPGTYKAEWQVLWADGTTETFPTLNTDFVRVSPDLDGSA